MESAWQSSGNDIDDRKEKVKNNQSILDLIEDKNGDNMIEVFWTLGGMRHT